MTSSHDYVDFDDTIAEYNKIINEYQFKNKQLYKLLSKTYEQFYVIAQQKGGDYYKVLREISEVLNEQTPTP